MTFNQLRTYIVNTFNLNGAGAIDGNEVQTALLELTNLLEVQGSWQPILTLINNGPNTVVKVTDWTGGQGVKPPINVYLGATAYVTDINVAVNLRGPQGLAGVPGNSVLTYATSPADGLSERFYPVCELPAVTGGTYDMVHIELMAKSWDISTVGWLKINAQFANRNVFSCEWTSLGSNTQCGLVAYQFADGRTVIYAVANNNFQALAVRVANNIQAIAFGPSAPVTSLTGGTLKYDSRSSTIPALQKLGPGGQYTSFLAGNIDQSPLPNAISSPGLSQLSLGANAISGSSDLALMNTNLVGGGFSFWQQVTATTRALLLRITASGDMGVGNIVTPAERLDVNGRIRSKGLVTNGNLPTIAKGTAVGGSGTATLIANSTDMAGGVTLATATGTTANGVLATVTFTAAYARAPRILISANNAQAANAMGRVFAVATATGFTLNSGVTALDNSVSMEFSYLIIA